MRGIQTNVPGAPRGEQGARSAVGEPRGCPDCLRRSWLLGLLAPHIERTAACARSPELLRLSNEDLAALAAPRLAEQLLERVAALSERHFERELSTAKCWACCRHEGLYPVGLRDAEDAPWALIGKGDPSLLKGLEPRETVTIVGARRASSYGREIARELGRELAGAGIVVVSGLAFGIDACAHRGALDAGPVIAVLGCGPDAAYPVAHRSLWRRIYERGLVVSELPPGATPWRWTFPARNRIMAALAGMTVVVEAAERSGSLITAGLAIELGRDVGAVPGPICLRTSAGPNQMLAGGACVVRGAQDVLDALLGPGVRRVERAGPALDRELREALGEVERGRDTCDALASALAIAGPQAAAALARLEVLGYVSCSLLGTYSRTLLQPPR